MFAGWFALGGVVLGVVLNGFSAWVMDRNALTSSVRVAALLVTEELAKSLGSLKALRRERVWGALNQSHDFGMRQAWEQNRAILGHSLSPERYVTIAAAYTGLAGAVDRALQVPPQQKVSDEENELLGSTYFAIGQAIAELDRFISRPSRLMPLARWHWTFERDVPAKIMRLAYADTEIEAFIADFTGSPMATPTEDRDMPVSNKAPDTASSTVAAKKPTRRSTAKKPQHRRGACPARRRN
ncbi:MAG TPA: hypothetical protein VMF09_12030 [Solirubrobacteraceae bacterium]|nr:hypothetical protein [Solirubrobacteraceae bacterium]